MSDNYLKVIVICLIHQQDKENYNMTHGWWLMHGINSLIIMLNIKKIKKEMILK